MALNQIALVFVSISFAFALNSKGFAMSMTEEEVGSTGDPAFWYTCQSSVIFLLGILTTALSAIRKDIYRQTRVLYWSFFFAGLGLSVISVIIYPVFNKGWSALTSFLASVMAAASALVLTQGTTQNNHNSRSQGKVKEE